MTPEEHAEILAAYIKRGSLYDLQQIHDAMRSAVNATLNLGGRAQLEADKRVDAAVLAFVKNMLPGDRDTVEKIILREGASLTTE